MDMFFMVSKSAKGWYLTLYRGDLATAQRMEDVELIKAWGPFVTPEACDNYKKRVGQKYAAAA